MVLCRKDSFLLFGSVIFFIIDVGVCVLVCVEMFRLKNCFFWWVCVLVMCVVIVFDGLFLVGLIKLVVVIVGILILILIWFRNGLESWV